MYLKLGLLFSKLSQYFLGQYSLQLDRKMRRGNRESREIEQAMTKYQRTIPARL